MHIVTKIKVKTLKKTITIKNSKKQLLLTKQYFEEKKRVVFGDIECGSSNRLSLPLYVHIS